jgi:diketogulonate reductase-like aldo/keto reductase
VRHTHIEENLAVFDFSLDADDMTALDALDEGRRFV